MFFEMRILCFILVIFGFGNDQVIANIRGTPGIDYPSYSSIPITSFKCSDQEQATGFYADPETRCQAFHYCYENRQETFLCPIGTTFNQAINSCDYWYSSECDSTDVLHTPPEEPNNGFNDQPFVPVNRPPYNVYEKMIALRDSNGNLYKQDGLSVIGDPQYENGDYFTGLTTSLGDLEETPQTDEQNLDFVPYDLDAVETDNIEIAFSKDEQLNAMHNNPNFAEEDSYNQGFSVSDEPDNFRFDTGETLHRMYQKEYISEEQVKEIPDIDSNAPNLDASHVGLNSDAMLYKRFSEVESKKRKIRRKPKYVVLQTNFAENPESQKSDPEHETDSSSKNTLVTYALDTNAIVSNENSASAMQIEYGKPKKNRKPLRKDHNYSMDDDDPVADIDKLDGYSEESDSQNDQLRYKDALDKIEIAPHVIKETSDSNLEYFHEFENTNIDVDKENENSEAHLENSNSKNNFTLNDADFLQNQYLNLEEPIEAEESHLESDTINPDGMKEFSNNENNYQVHELSDLGENDFIQEHAEESLRVDNLLSESENGLTSTGMFNSNESSDTSTGDIVESEKFNNLSPNIVVNNEFKKSQNNQNYLESSKESTYNDIINNGNNLNLEFMNDIVWSENHKFEDANIELRDGKKDTDPGFRINSKYLNFEKNDFERSRLNEMVEDHTEDSTHSTDGQEVIHFKDTQTESEINVDSLEYFESEGQGYFMDEYGRIYILSGENEESETLIYVGDIDSEGNSEIDFQDISLPQTENSPEVEPVREDSYFPTEAEDNFDLVDSTENEFGTDAVEPKDIDESTEDNLDFVLDEEIDQRLAENLIPQEEDSDLANFEETLAEHNITSLLQVIGETDVSQSNLNQTNVTADYPVDTNLDLLKDFKLKDAKSSKNKENSTNGIEIFKANNDKMAQDLDKLIDSQFPLSSIPLPANDYEKGLYDEKRNAQRDSNTLNSVSPTTFYKELQAVPVTEKNNPAKSKIVGDFPSAELLDIKSRLFRNIRSDLASDEVKSAVVNVGFPSKIIDNLFSSYSSPFQPAQGNMAGYFPLQSPKFRTIPDFPKRTSKKFKPPKIFRLIKFGKKLLKMKRATLNNLKKYFSF